MEQFAENPSASTVMDLPPKVNAKVDSSIKESNPFRPDSELGDLNHRFDSKLCKIPTNEEMVALNSRVIVLNNDVQHVMHGGRAEFYLMDDLHWCPHSFENGSKLPSPQTSPLVTIQYPIGVDYFSDDLSVARAGGKVFHTFFGDAQINVSYILKFILHHGCSNSLRDGNHTEESGQHHRVFMGYCGQAYTEETIQGHKVPKAVYGVDIFDKLEDVEEHTSLKAMIVDILDHMQWLFD